MIYSETTTPFSEEDESTNRNILDSPTTTTTIIRVVESDGDYMKVTTMTNIGETASSMSDEDRIETKPQKEDTEDTEGSHGVIETSQTRTSRFTGAALEPNQIAPRLARCFRVHCGHSGSQDPACCPSLEQHQAVRRHTGSRVTATITRILQSISWL